MCTMHVFDEKNWISFFWIPLFSGIAQIPRGHAEQRASFAPHA